MANRAGASAQALSYLWISEDALVKAFRRFELVSRSHRRYGSHVPGPMEAHRRTAKRKIAMAATSSESPATFDLDVLFGNIWSRSSAEPEREWKWTAPSRIVEVGSKAKGRAMTSRTDMLIARESTVSTIERTTTIQDLAATSGKEFNNLIEELRGEDVIDVEDLAPCLEYLASDKDILEAQNALHLAEFLSTRHSTRQALSAFFESLVTMTKLEPSSRTELAHVTAVLWRNPTSRRRIRPVLRRNVDRLPLLSAKRFATTVTRLIVDDNYPSGPHTRLRATMDWLNTIQKFATLANINSVGDVWQEMYEIVQDKWNPSELKDHLSRLSPDCLCRVLLRHWLPWASQSVSRSIDKGGHILLDFQRPPAETSINNANLLLNVFDQEVATSDATESAVSCFSAILRVMRRNHLPYQQLYCALFEIYSFSRSPEIYVPAFLEMARPGSGLEPPVRLLDSLMTQLLVTDTADSVRLAQKVFQKFPSVSCSASSGLATALIKHGYVDGVWPQRIFDVLSRRTAADISSKPSNKIPKSKALRLNTAQIKAVEEVALQWVSAPSLTPRQAWRRAWSCYRFLQDRGVPMSADILYALLEGGILRFVKARQNVPEEQLRFVLSHVVKLEGSAAAERLRGTVERIREQIVSSVPKAARLPTPSSSPKRFKVRPWGSHQRLVPHQQIDVWGRTRQHPRGVRVRNSTY